MRTLGIQRTRDYGIEQHFYCTRDTGLVTQTQRLEIRPISYDLARRYVWPIGMRAATISADAAGASTWIKYRIVFWRLGRSVFELPFTFGFGAAVPEFGVSFDTTLYDSTSGGFYGIQSGAQPPVRIWDPADSSWVSAGCFSFKCSADQISYELDAQGNSGRPGAPYVRGFVLISEEP